MVGRSGNCQCLVGCSDKVVVVLLSHIGVVGIVNWQESPCVCHEVIVIGMNVPTTASPTTGVLVLESGFAVEAEADCVSYLAIVLASV